MGSRRRLGQTASNSYQIRASNRPISAADDLKACQAAERSATRQAPRQASQPAERPTSSANETADSNTKDSLNDGAQTRAKEDCVQGVLRKRSQKPLDAHAPKNIKSRQDNRLTCDNCWSRGADLNHRPSGYEPDELTRLLHPAMYVRRLSAMGKAARKNITLSDIEAQALLSVS